jgi:hypothetical protein
MSGTPRVISGTGAAPRLLRTGVRAILKASKAAEDRIHDFRFWFGFEDDAPRQQRPQDVACHV